MKSILKSLLVAALLLPLSVFAGQLNINTATAEELDELKGIGVKKAASIVTYRTEHGDFSNIDDLTNVKGIGEKLLEKIKEEITVKKNQ